MFLRETSQHQLAIFSAQSNTKPPSHPLPFFVAPYRPALPVLPSEIGQTSAFNSSEYVNLSLPPLPELDLSLPPFPELDLGNNDYSGVGGPDFDGLQPMDDDWPAITWRDVQSDELPENCDLLSFAKWLIP